MPIRILIVEDQSALADNLLEFLGEERYTLDFAADGLTALHLLATQSYDVVVLDVMLPGLSGFEICKRIRRDLNCSSPVIFMTARGSLSDKEEGFALGGDDYLVKPFALRELQLRIDALAKRRSEPTGLLQAGLIRYDPSTLKVVWPGVASVELSGISARVFELLVRNHPAFVSHEAISRAIWGIDEGDANSLRTHIYMLRKLLQSAFEQPMIRTLHGRGYCLDVPVARSEEASNHSDAAR